MWVDPADADHVVIGEAPGIRVSTDGGRTFADAEVPNTSAAVGTFVAVEVPDGPSAGTELLVAGAARWRPYGLAANGAAHDAASTSQGQRTRDMAKEKNLDDLFYDTLKDIYYAEKQILKALPKMARAAQSEELKAG